MRLSTKLLPVFILLLLSACAGGNKEYTDSGSPIHLRYAKNLRIDSIDDCVELVTLRNPWDTTKTFARYALVKRGAESPSHLPEGTIEILVPVERSVVYSGVHIALLDELGTGQSVNGICDAAYVNNADIRARIAGGNLTDCGASTQPVMERIISLRPDIVLLSPYENSDDSGTFARIGINVVQAADYMESNPLARAEWMRFYGRLYGCGHSADSLFAEVEKRYIGIRRTASNATTKPSVLFDRIYNGQWSVPTSGSATGHLIADAGGRNPFDSYTSGGSAQLTPEEVLHTAQDADIWLIRHNEPRMTLHRLGSDNRLYTQIKAYKNGNVLGCNTLERPLFEDGSFHPDLVLEEMVRIFHPDMLSDPDTLRYYKQIGE